MVWKLPLPIVVALGSIGTALAGLSTGWARQAGKAKPDCLWGFSLLVERRILLRKRTALSGIVESVVSETYRICHN